MSAVETLQRLPQELSKQPLTPGMDGIRTRIPLERSVRFLAHLMNKGWVSDVRIWAEAPSSRYAPCIIRPTRGHQGLEETDPYADRYLITDKIGEPIVRGRGSRIEYPLFGSYLLLVRTTPGHSAQLDINLKPHDAEAKIHDALKNLHHAPHLEEMCQPTYYSTREHIHPSTLRHN